MAPTGPMSFEQSKGYCTVPHAAHRIRNCADQDCALAGRCLGSKQNAVPDATGTPCVGEVTDFKGQIDGKGYKASMDDPTKLPLWLVPVMLIRGVAAVLGFGAKKYASNNWRKGMAWSEVYSALQRHLTAWIEGDENDKDSGLSHLWHAACCLAFLIEYAAFPALYGRFDDRFKRPEA